MTDATTEEHARAEQGEASGSGGVGGNCPPPKLPSTTSGISGEVAASSRNADPLLQAPRLAWREQTDDGGRGILWNHVSRFIPRLYIPARTRQLG